MSDATNYAENKIADHMLGTASWTAPSGVYLKLHTGAPGEDATANAATETTRQSASFDAASGGVASLSSAVTWTNVSTTETVTHVSGWDASTAGNALFVAALDSSVSLTAGDNFQLDTLDVTVA